MALPCARLLRLRSAAVCRLLYKSSSSQAVTATEEIEVPRKKTWDKTAVLKALAYTVSNDPTSSGYIFVDDPYLLPKSTTDYVMYSKTKESGRNAAKYIVDTYPMFFEKDLAEPHIPCLMPENMQIQIEGVSEEALSERINLRRLKESVDMYDQLVQAGTPPSLETTNRLLDLLCFYGDKEPSTESQQDPELENEDARNRKTPESKNVMSWRKDNNAERIFNLMEEKDAHSYRTMIRGMVKHGAIGKAFGMYTDLLNNRLTGDVHTFNALIAATPEVKSDQMERWSLIVDLINQMNQQNVQPNLQTFNAILKGLRKTNLRGMAVQTINEMKALNIEPCLTTYFHMLSRFYKSNDLSLQAKVLEQILDYTEGKTFTAQDPEDVKFFSFAMKVCLDTKDLELAYRLDALKNTGDNWKLLGDRNMQNHYYGRFFNLICMMESVDVAYKWYRENIPSNYIPKSWSILNLLQVIEVENRLELIPEIWKDLFLFGHLNRDQLFQEILRICTREKTNPQLQEEFANIAATIKVLYDPAGNQSSQLKMSAGILGDITILLCRAGRTGEAWNTLKSFKSESLVPGTHVISELMDSAKASGNSSAAVDLVQMAVSYGLPDTNKLAQTVLEEFTLSEEHRITLKDLTSNDDSGSSSSSSSSDSDEK